MNNNCAGKKVLIFGAGGRQALPVCKGFFEIGCIVITYCQSRFDTGYLTRYKSKNILYNEKNSEGLSFFDFGKKIILEGQYDLVVPLGDKSASYLAEHKAELEELCHIAVNDLQIFNKAIDKAKTMKICEQNRIPAPKTLIGNEILPGVEAGLISFPVVVKPRTGVGSIGFQIISSIDKLRDYITNYDNKNGPLLVQEYIEQGKHPQYRCDLFRDRDGKFRMVMVGKVTRWYPLDGGSGIFAYTVHDKKIANDCMRLLDALNWNGYANIDLVYDIKSNVAKILEINTRTGATIKLDYLAGANVSKLIVENELGLPVTDMVEYPDNIRLTCLLPDLLWFVKSIDRFKTEPSWFDRKGVKDAIFDWSDPLPTFGFLATRVMSFRSASKKRQRVNGG